MRHPVIAFVAIKNGISNWLVLKRKKKESQYDNIIE